MTELLRYSYPFGGATDHEQSLFEPITGGYPYLSKKPADTVRIARAFEADPQLFVIALVRDPRSVVTSVHWSHPDVYYVGFGRWRFYADTIARLSNHPRYCVVRYEDLVRDPAAEQQRVEERVPCLPARRRAFAAFPDGASELHDHASKALNGVRPFDASRIDAWRAHLPRVRAELDANPDLPRWLERFGYEPDDAWAVELEGIEPAGRSYKDAPARGLKRLDRGLRDWRNERRYLKSRDLR